MNSNIKERLTKIFKDAKLAIKSPILLEIVNRSFVYSEVNMDAKALICGINPSYRKNETNLDSYSYNFDDLEGDKYYKKFHKLIKPYKEEIKFTYIDLFYQRHTEQKKINNFTANEALKFICEQLVVTQSLIEQLQPKFILVFNKQAANFLGKNNKQNLSNVWLGYKFEEIKKDKIYKICGFEDSEQRINRELSATNLEGTLIYFSRFLGRISNKDLEQIELDIAELMSYKI